MSYRISVNGVQLFGNNASYPEWDGYIRSQGITPDGDGCYEGELSDFHAGVLALEATVKRLMSERKADASSRMSRVLKVLAENPDNDAAKRAAAELGQSYLDFSEYEHWIDERIQTVFDVCWEIATMGYAFMPFAFWMACRDMLEPDEPEFEPPDGPLRVRKFRFKPGMKARIKAG